ncbi:hypothetical protein EGW08_020875, partial [Elysia chlorotica]
MALANPFPYQIMNPPAQLPPPAPTVQQAPPLSSSDLDLGDKYNMSSGSFTDALLTLSAFYIGLVQTEGPVPVGLHAFFPSARGTYLKKITDPFASEQKSFLTLKNYRNIAPEFKISMKYTNHKYVPKDLLETMCTEVFPHNVIAFFYMNNPLGVQTYPDPTVKYLPQLMESLGLPIISYDTQFSLNTQPALSVQLAPTIGQMMDVFFAFLRRYNWHDFSFLCTLSVGCEDELATLRRKVEESNRKLAYSVYGDQTFSFKLLSYVNFTDGGDVEEVTEKLKYELHQDSRIMLVHGEGGEVKDMMAVAAELGLTGKEYVWIYTITSFTRSAHVNKNYPLGSFVIGYDSQRDDMDQVVENGVSIYLQALDSLAASPEMKDIDFETGFSCDRDRSDSGNNSGDSDFHASRRPLKWPYGHLLYNHMLKAKLPGGLEFDHQGVLKANMFWIKNVQLKSSDTPQSSSSSDSRTGGSIIGNSRGSSSRGSLIGSSRSPSRGSLIGRGRGSSSGGYSSGEETSSSDRSPLGSRDRTGDLTSSPFSSRPRPDRGGGGGRLFSQGRDSSDRTPSQSSSDYSSDTSRSWRPTRPLYGRNSGLSKRSSGLDVGDSGLDASSFGDTDWRASYSKNKRRSRDLGERRPSIGGDNHEGVVGDPEEELNRRLWRRSVHRLSASHRLRARRSMLNRRKRATLVRVAETIAVWDGRNLTVTGLTWPGGASTPPKGKPEKYTLRVVTWKEDPQVKYTELRNVTEPGESPCDANSLPCKIYQRNASNVRVSNQTRDVCCTGLCIDLLKKLGEMLHFDVNLTEVDEGAYGSPLNDNRTEWNGMLGKLVDGEADMAMGALSITPQRLEVVDFSVPFLQTGITIIVAIREGAISATAFL